MVEAAAPVDAAGGGAESRQTGIGGGMQERHGSPEKASSVFRDRGDGDDGRRDGELRRSTAFL